MAHMATPLIHHGLRVQFKDNLAGAIATGNESVVGIVGTAPDAEAAVAASITVGSGNSAVRFLADTAGASGNNISVQFVAGDGANAALAVSVDDKAIEISLATDADGAVVSTAAQVVAAVNGDADVAAIVTASNGDGGDGSGVARVAVRSNLANGADEAFPVNEPVLISSVARFNRMGKSGTLYDGVRDVWRTSGRYAAVVVAIRVDGADAAAQRANAIAALPAFQDAELSVGVKPRLLCAPEMSDDLAVGLQLVTTGKRMSALAIIDGDATSFDNAVAYGRNFDKAVVCYPKWRVFDEVAKEFVNRAPSALAAGHIARVDSDEGWQHSPSNRVLDNVVGASPAVAFDINDPSSTANLLNQQFLTTIVKFNNAVRFWGNRTADGENITKYRVQRIIADAVAKYVAEFVDRNIDLPFFDFVLRKIQGFLDDQTGRGILTGGRAWVDPDLNTAESLAANRVFFSMEVGIAGIAEDIVISQQVSNSYNEQIVREAAQLGAAN